MQSIRDLEKAKNGFRRLCVLNRLSRSSVAPPPCAPRAPRSLEAPVDPVVGWSQRATGGSVG
jgi:hypothetical protein